MQWLMGLESTTKERDVAQRRAQALEAAGGGIGGNLFSIGLDDEDPAKEAKLALLKDLVKENRDVRSFMNDTGGSLPPPAPSESSESGGVKKIQIKRVAPPPLQQTE